MAVSSKLESAAPKIPVDTEIVLLPEFDPELKEFNRRVGIRFFDKGKEALRDTQPRIPKILMIEARNEFGEGAYIEPTKKWGMRYLETIKKVFKPAGTKQ